jgi:hypothetical protein
MSRFYFHLSGPNESFPDAIGWDLRDLAAAHKRAITLAERVMTVSKLADYGRDWRRWKVQIVDDNAQLVLVLMFPPCDRQRQQATTRAPAGPAPCRTL